MSAAFTALVAPNVMIGAAAVAWTGRDAVSAAIPETQLNAYSDGG